MDSLEAVAPSPRVFPLAACLVEVLGLPLLYSGSGSGSGLTSEFLLSVPYLCTAYTSSGSLVLPLSSLTYPSSQASLSQWEPAPGSHMPTLPHAGHMGHQVYPRRHWLISLPFNQSCIPWLCLGPKKHSRW